MPEPVDIENLLQTGYWVSSRAKSPKPPPPSAPVRANQSSKLDPQIPRSFNADLIRRYPPPASVEDEAESLAKEHGGSNVSGSADEEPKFRGAPDQMPILLPVLENNPERRFVILSSSSDVTEDSDHTPTSHARKAPPKATSTGRTEYQANTARKYDLAPEDDNKVKDPPRKPTHERRKSRQDLPPLDTTLDLGSAASNISRARSATHVENRPRDYFDHQESHGAPGDGLLSPVIKHSTKGRERAYWDLSHSRPSNTDLKLSPSDERRHDDGWPRSSQSAHPSVHVRTNSTIEVPKTSRRTSEKYGYGGEPSSPGLSRRTSSPPRSAKNTSPPSLVRKGSSPPHSQPARERMTHRSSSYKQHHGSPPREEDEPREDEYRNRQRPDRHRRSSVVTQEDRISFLSPDQARPSVGGRSRSRVNTPLASPRITEESFPQYDIASSPRSTKDNKQASERFERPVSPFSPTQSSPPRSKSKVSEGDRASRPRGNSRATSVIQEKSPSVLAIPIPIPGSSGHDISGDRQKSPMPPSHSRQNSLESSPPTKASWPPPFDPSQNGTSLSQSAMSFRRYSEEVSHGNIPRLPECPRTRPTAGHNDWHTLLRSDNFNICPSCYDAVFADSSFKHQFGPAPARSDDKRIACSFGSSPWYRIAWLMTLKYRFPDLRLMNGIANVTAKNQPCSGRRNVMRIWYSIKDPHTQRPLQAFNICFSCAKTIEVLLPNLIGVFMPLDSPAVAAPGVCAMHYASDRRRFIEYFDLMETASDRAVSRKSAPNIQTLANEVRRISLIDECGRDQPVADRKWFVMEAMPEYTVCEECFEQVVDPNLEGKSSSAVARNFYKRQVYIEGHASCQLYSDRMREIFKKACRRNDLDYFVARAQERQDVQRDIHAKLRKLEQGHVGDVWTEEEMDKLYVEWKKWE